MTDKRKLRAMREALKAPTVITRRVITDTREKINADAEMEEKIARNAERVANEEEARAEALVLQDEEANPYQEALDAWEVPASLRDFQNMVREMHPLWSPARQSQQALMMYQRHPFIAKAMKAGLAIGRDLRERAEYKVGWWWPELQDLMPAERTYVCDRIRDIIMQDKRKEH